MEGLNHTSWERSGLEGYGRPQLIHLGSEVVEKAMESLNHTSWERSGLEGYGRPQP